MPARRKTHRKTYTSASGDFSVIVEIIDEIEIKSGQGQSFQRTIMTLPDNGERVKKIKRIYDPNNSKEFVEIPVNEQVVVKSGSGISYQKRTYFFVNDESNQERVVRIDQVHSSQDNDKTLEVEVIKEFTVKSGSGQTYEKRTFILDQSDLPGIRETIG